jgi:type II secretory pathway pseudopilin PulG
MDRYEPTHRRGVTLIELLVVITIFIALATMIVMAAPRFGQQQAPSRGASQLQSWLNLARAMAIRDQRPRGLRLLPPTNSVTNTVPLDANYCRELIYIEQPDHFKPGIDNQAFDSRLSVPAKASNQFPPGSMVAPDEFRFVRLTNTQGTITSLPPDPLAPIWIGDVLHVTDPDVGAKDFPRRVLNITPVTGDPDDFIVELDKPLIPLTAAVPAPPPQYSTGAFIFYRQPRPMVGEPTLQLPRDVGIDFSREANPPPGQQSRWHRFYPLTPTGGGQPIDILFSPDGHLMGSLAALSSRVNLWVRDVSQDWNDLTTQVPVMPPGDNTLISIHTRTGLVTAHPIDPSGLQMENSSTAQLEWNPFRFTQDSLSSGQ